MQTADVVIVGAGVVGLSIAYHLAASNNNLKIIIVEREKFPGMGSTAQCTGNISLQFPCRVNIEMTWASLPYFKRFSAEMQYPIYFRQRGNLYLTAEPERLKKLKKTVTLLNDLNIPVEFLIPPEIKKRYPFIYTGDLVGGTLCDLDGYADPHGVTQGYFNQARKRGVEVLTGEAVMSIRTAGGMVASVQTDKRRIVTSIVVDAAGPCFAEVAAMAGIKLPAGPYRSQFYVCEPVPAIGRGIPLIVDIDSGLSIHAEKSGTLILGSTRLKKFPGSVTAVDWSLLDDFIEAAVHRVPPMEATGLKRACVGIECLTPDCHGIIGETGAIKGFYCAGGFSGHGFMHAPAIGLITARLILEKNFDGILQSDEKLYTKTTSGRKDDINKIDVLSLSPDRFTENRHFLEDFLK